jgi:hypothetical protein
LEGFLKNMPDDKANHWNLVWETTVNNLGVKGLRGSTYRSPNRDVVEFGMSYHGKVFSAELSGTVLISDGAGYAVQVVAEKLIAEACEWLASSLEQMVNLLPKDWDGDRPPPGKPTNTWENLFKDEG